jgi:hypothetical protein
MANKQVVVKSNSGTVQRGQEAVILSRESGDGIRWVSECDKPVLIVFASNEGSPFKSRVFKLRAKGNVQSGPLVGKSKKRGAVGVYKYTIMGASANNDPIIIVND